MSPDFSKPSDIVSQAPATIGITLTFILSAFTLLYGTYCFFLLCDIRFLCYSPASFLSEVMANTSTDILAILRPYFEYVSKPMELI